MGLFYASGKKSIFSHSFSNVFFKSCSRFFTLSDSCLRSLALEFTTQHFAPGDIVYHRGETLDEIGFVVSGSLEVIQDDELVAILSNGDVFGDTLWLQPGGASRDSNKKPHTSMVYVRALTYSDIHQIKRKSLNKVLGFYTQFAKSFMHDMNLTYNLRTKINTTRIEHIKVVKNNLGDSKLGLKGLIGGGFNPRPLVDDSAKKVSISERNGQNTDLPDQSNQYSNNPPMTPTVAAHQSTASQWSKPDATQPSILKDEAQSQQPSRLSIAFERTMSNSVDSLANRVLRLENQNSAITSTLGTMGETMSEILAEFREMKRRKLERKKSRAGGLKGVILT